MRRIARETPLDDSRRMDRQTSDSTVGTARRTARERQIIAFFGVIALLFIAGGEAQARLAPLPEESIVAPTDNRVSELVRRVQNALTKLGLYVGPEDGRLSPATVGAIRIYQRSTGLEVDGRATKDLGDHMFYTLGVRRLLRRLDVVRREGKSTARDKLMSHPATRDLITGADETPVAKAGRDPAPCFRSPTVRCLLDEARESSKAVFKAELRDWALGEVLIAEARAGLGVQAMETASRIKDPRLILVALRDIAEAQAAGGHPKDALAAAAIIPDPDKNAEALLAIARLQLQRGDAADARATLTLLSGTLDAMDDPVARIHHLARSAVLFSASGDGAAAKSALATAETEARNLADKWRGMALRHVASALADMRDTHGALVILEDVGNAADRVPVLMTAAEAQARAGDMAAALTTANSIGPLRYRAMVLGKIAILQAAAGDEKAAAATLATAMAAVSDIKRPYARSYAISRIVIAMLRIIATMNESVPPTIDFNTAIEAAGRIEDTRLRAHALWRIHADQIRSGDASTTAALAEEATAAITGDLSRVWMFTELASEHALGGNSAGGWTSFGQALRYAEEIGNPWARTRATAKLATTLIQLVGSGPASRPPH